MNDAAPSYAARLVSHAPRKAARRALLGTCIYFALRSGLAGTLGWRMLPPVCAALAVLALEFSSPRALDVGPRCVLLQLVVGVAIALTGGALSPLMAIWAVSGLYQAIGLGLRGWGRACPAIALAGTWGFVLADLLGHPLTDPELAASTPTAPTTSRCSWSCTC